MSAPRAVGRRASYAAMPAQVTEWVEHTLGSPVVQAEDQVGGFSPGCATRVRCADGTRAFVKAVGAELNPDTPTLFRREVLALTLLGSHPLWATLLASYDSGAAGGDWVALLLEDVEGTHPDLDDDATMERLLTDTDAIGAVLRERVPQPPRQDALVQTAPPAPPGDTPMYRAGLVDVTTVFTAWADTFDMLGDLPRGLLPHWVLDHHSTLADAVRRLALEPCNHLVHADIRNDNLLQRDDGSIVFLDWGAVGVGPDWLDPLLARLERVDTAWFDSSLTGSAALRVAGPEVVTSWLVGMGAHLAYRAHTSEVVNLPTLGDFRRRESARFLRAAARRLGH